MSKIGEPLNAAADIVDAAVQQRCFHHFGNFFMAQAAAAQERLDKATAGSPLAAWMRTQAGMKTWHDKDFHVSRTGSELNKVIEKAYPEICVIAQRLANEIMTAGLDAVRTDLANVESAVGQKDRGRI